MDEKGPFGKSTRRRGSSRGTRTQTPAKKENLALDGFEVALMFDADRGGDPQDLGSTVSKPQSELQRALDGSGSLHNVAIPEKEPCQVVLYGFPPPLQYAAISFYEKASNGIICEDYEREAPVERKRFQNGLGKHNHVHPRPLTVSEQALARQYKGGECWIRVTFDSTEAAERAMYFSPHILNGYSVRAMLFRGHGPEADTPIFATEEDLRQGTLGPSRQAIKTSQTIGTSFPISWQSRTNASTATSFTLPRSFAPGANNQPNGQLHETVSADSSSSTASSATATNIDYPDLHQRSGTGISTMQPSNNISTPVRSKPPTFTHFPNTPRTMLHPASEAFLPQQSWMDRMYKQMTDMGLIPGTIIGNVVPRLENGDFDWPSASFYWRICYWMDVYLGTDLCGTKEA